MLVHTLVAATTQLYLKGNTMPWLACTMVLNHLILPSKCMMWVKNAGTYTKGVTLLPNAILDPSPDNDVYIITSNRLDNLNRALNFGHEAYGHAWFYERMRRGENVNPNHEPKSIVVGQEWDDILQTFLVINGREDMNKELVEQLDAIQKEILEYMKNNETL